MAPFWWQCRHMLLRMRCVVRAMLSAHTCDHKQGEQVGACGKTIFGPSVCFVENLAVMPPCNCPRKFDKN